jgi:hypothetical protein
MYVDAYLIVNLPAGHACLYTSSLRHEVKINIAVHYMLPTVVISRKVALLSAVFMHQED